MLDLVLRLIAVTYSYKGEVVTCKGSQDVPFIDGRRVSKQFPIARTRQEGSSKLRQPDPNIPNEDKKNYSGRARAGGHRIQS